MVGSAIVRELERRGFSSVLTASHHELDLTDQAAARAFFERERPEYVFLAAARVGGIVANSSYPADFIYDNLAIAMNVINAAHRSGVRALLHLGSSCIYPRDAVQPMREDALLTGPLEATNEPYAIAKIAAIKLCASYNRQHQTNFMSLMPTNLYGIGDNYDPVSSHVLPALIGKFHRAATTGAGSVTLWGDGSPLREFLWADDLAAAAVMLMDGHQASEPQVGDWINVGSGEEVTIGHLADTVRQVICHELGMSPTSIAIEWDAEMPNGTPRKLLDSSRIRALGWAPTTSLHDGIRAAYADYVAGVARS